MSETSTEEHTNKMRARYARLTGRKARGKMLDPDEMLLGVSSGSGILHDSKGFEAA